MALIDCKEPIFDNQVEQILRGLEDSKSRAEIAVELGYKNPISLDNYMRRRNFSWDSRQKNFVPAAERYSAKARDNVTPLHGTSKVTLILSLFEQGESDAKEIARQVGLSDHKELAAFMKGKGFAWDAGRGNYVKAPERNTKKSLSELIEHSLDIQGEATPSLDAGQDVGDLGGLLPILRLLQRNGEKLQNLLEEPSESEKMPRYSLPGSFTCKTVHMVNSLDQLVKNFSKEKNVSQREIFEVALVEFFRRYGYRDEVNQLLG